MKCFVCLELKPRFFKPPNTLLMRSKQQWENVAKLRKSNETHTNSEQVLFNSCRQVKQISVGICCQRSLHSKRHICFIPTILFSIFRPPLAVHCDRGSVFKSSEFKSSWTVGWHAKRDPFRTIKLLTANVRG